MDTIYVGWSYLKDMIDNGNATFKYVETTQKYVIHVQDEQLVYAAEIFKDFTGVGGLDTTQNSSDKTDFETNYKANASPISKPKGKRGIPKVLVSTDVDDQSMYVTGSSASITGATNVVDSNFGFEVKLQGVNICVKDADENDTMDFEIGYVDGNGDWIKVKAFGEAILLCDGPTWHEYHFKSGAVSIIPTTVKARLIYNQADIATTKKVIVHYITHVDN